jgi:hypothetical protein
VEYYRVILTFPSENLGDIKHQGYTLRFNGILEVDINNQQGFSMGAIASQKIEPRYLQWCLEKQCLMCDHCAIAVSRKFVSEYLILGTNKRLYFGTTCDQTVVGEVIRLYLKVIDNWFTVRPENYPQSKLPQKTVKIPSHCHQFSELPSGYYTITKNREYLTGRIINILGKKESFYIENPQDHRLQPGQLFRKLGQETIHIIPCPCAECQKPKLKLC